MSGRRGSCHVADQFCEAAANFEVPGPVTRCFRCGDDVCTKCSSRRKYLRFGLRRLCNDCQIEEDGNDRTVLRRLHRLAAS